MTTLAESWGVSVYIPPEVIDDYLAGEEIANTVKRKLPLGKQINWKIGCTLKTLPKKCKMDDGCISCLSEDERKEVLLQRKLNLKNNSKE